jgi:hypothetical protein
VIIFLQLPTAVALRDPRISPNLGLTGFTMQRHRSTSCGQSFSCMDSLISSITSNPWQVFKSAVAHCLQDPFLMIPGASWELASELLPQLVPVFEPLK